MNRTQGTTRPVPVCQTHLLPKMTPCEPNRLAGRRRQTATLGEKYRLDLPPIFCLPSPPTPFHSPASTWLGSHLQLVEERPLSSAGESFSAPTAMPGLEARTGSPATACPASGTAPVHWDQAETAWGIGSRPFAAYLQVMPEKPGSLLKDDRWKEVENALRDVQTDPGQGGRENGSARPVLQSDQVQQCGLRCSFASFRHLPKPCRVMLFRPGTPDTAVQHGVDGLLGPNGGIDVNDDEGNHDCCRSRVND